MVQLKCPTCRKQFRADESKSLPFCSPRCRQIDLGRWLEETNRMPVFPSPDDEGAEYRDEPSD